MSYSLFFMLCVGFYINIFVRPNEGYAFLVFIIRWLYANYYNLFKLCKIHDDCYSGTTRL